MTPKVSILMPCRDSAQYIVECLDSIVEQTFSEWELIAIDDHSEDDTRGILQQYAAHDSRITVLPNEGKGIIPAMQLAYEHSRGEYITRMDSDDRMSAFKLELMYRQCVDHPKGLVVGLVEYFSDTDLGEGYRKYADWLNTLTWNADNWSDIYKECVVPSACWMMSRQNLNACGAFDSDRYPEDYDLCFRMYQQGLDIIPVREVLHYWRDHSARASRNDDNYANNTFIPIKVHHFFEGDYDENRSLVVWGAGAKGKTVAKELLDRQIPFEWMCNNENKIGKHIYGVLMLPLFDVKQLRNTQLIIAIANPKENANIRQQLGALSQEQNVSSYFFA